MELVVLIEEVEVKGRSGEEENDGVVIEVENLPSPDKAPPHLP